MNIETGFKCESCGKLLEDRPPVDEDFRTPPGETRRRCGACLENKAIDEAIFNISAAGAALSKHTQWAMDQITAIFDRAIKETGADQIKVAHVVGPLGSNKCPKCGGEGEKRGSWEWGPYWWECEDCKETWGYA